MGHLYLRGRCAPKSENCSITNSQYRARARRTEAITLGRVRASLSYFRLSTSTNPTRAFPRASRDGSCSPSWTVCPGYARHLLAAPRIFGLSAREQTPSRRPSNSLEQRLLSSQASERPQLYGIPRRS
ncbi:hypothetical protein OH76DRAFT_355431 [Lentinus brumalis]|uniref:Uncharacterized protein n=1 Tax=Lentinus brumalis TaxID=2498619 RepID=A0A371DF68_9APHY|nr:hypothetical protein OH76DRAFT_355431 [Polyporus brumalis]